MSWRDTPPESPHEWAVARSALVVGPPIPRADVTPPAPDGVHALVDPAALIGAGDVLALCGWKQRKSIHDARAREFPEPVAVVSGMRLWVRADVEQWQAEQEAK